MRLLLLLVAPIVAFCQDAGIQKSLLQDTGDKALERSYLLYVPENLHRQPALVVVMHGYSSSSENIMRYSGMNEIASTQGFIVAYPQGTIDHKGNAFFNVGYAFHRDLVIDDLSFKSSGKPITSEIDTSSSFNKISHDSRSLSPRIACFKYAFASSKLLIENFFVISVDPRPST